MYCNKLLIYRLLHHVQGWLKVCAHLHSMHAKLTVALLKGEGSQSHDPKLPQPCPFDLDPE